MGWRDDESRRKSTLDVLLYHDSSMWQVCISYVVLYSVQDDCMRRLATWHWWDVFGQGILMYRMYRIFTIAHGNS